MFLLPQGYQTELVAVFEPNQILSGLTALEVGYPEGTAMLLRVNLQSAPADPDSTLAALNQASIGLTPWSTPTVLYDATENAIYINYVHSSGDIQALQTMMSTQGWQMLLIVAGALLLLTPLISSIIEPIITMVMMFVMMYMMSGIMKAMQPDNKPAQVIHDTQSRMIQGAKKYLGIAIKKGKEYADKIDPSGKADLQKLAQEAKYGVEPAKNAISGLWNSSTAGIIEDIEDDIL